MRDGVFGRDAELERLAGFVGGLRAAPGALVLAGPAGTGKTTLLRAAAALAADQGLRVLQAFPASSELRLAFAGVTDLLEPCLDEVLDKLPAPQRQALRVALLLAEAPPQPPDPRAIAAAFRSAIGVLACRVPVLLIIDDVQWLDTVSEAAIGFAIRRMEGEPVGLLCAQRTAVPGESLPLELSRARIPTSVLPVGGLSLGAMHRALRTQLGVSFPHPVLRRIAAASGGNPFVALEIGRALRRLGPAAMLGSELAVPGTVSALVQGRLAALAPEVTGALQLAAVMPNATEEMYLAAGMTGEALDGAVLAGILELQAGRFRFAHPLLAAVVADAIPPARKRELHAAAATVVQRPEERARHRALATVGRSGTVAQEVAAAAAEAATRGAPASAAELYQLAVSLAPEDDQVRSRGWQLAAARQLALGGEMTAATTVLERLARSVPPGPDRADVLSELAVLREHDYAAATGLMERALLEAGDDPVRAADIRLSLADIWSIRGDGDKAALAAAQGLADAERAGSSDLTASALAQLFQYAVMRGAAADERQLQRALELESAAGNLILRTPPSWVAGWYFACMGRLDEADTAIGRLLARAERQGVEYWRAHVFRCLAATAALRGDARRAAKIAAEGLEIAEQLDFPYTTSTLLYAAGWAALHLGEAGEVRELTARGQDLAAQTGADGYVLLHQALRASLELALGNGAAAAERIRPLIGRLDVLGLRPTVASLTADAVEALITAGDLDQAGMVIEQRARALPDPVTAALLTRCRGALAAARGDLSAAAAEFATALDLLERMSPMPLERGRTLLMLGAVQRRLKQRAAARATLTESLRLFGRASASLWEARAQAELARISGRAAAAADLTSTERQVAELVSRGMSNREVAAKLVVSVRAVESTLTKVYAKLGVRSRTELALRLKTLP